MNSTEMDLSTTSSKEDQGEKSKAVEENNTLPNQEPQTPGEVEAAVEEKPENNAQDPNLVSQFTFQCSAVSQAYQND